MLTDPIFSLVWDISDWFYRVYAETNGWAWPFNLVAPFFYQLSLVFWNLLTPIAKLGEWIDSTSSALRNLLSWSAIRGLIIGWLPNLEAINLWFSNWWQQIRWSIEEWWWTTSATVQGWISAATQGLNDLLTAWNNFWTITWPQWLAQLNALGSDLNSFFTLTLPTLVSFTWLETWWGTKSAGLGVLIVDTIKVCFPFYNELVALWNGIAEFFADPEDWLYKSIDRIVERFW